MKLLLILNRDAGTLRGADVEKRAAELVEIFRKGGHQVALQIASGGETIAAIEEAAKARAAEVIVVGGGDGTVSAAAAIAAANGIALGVLPLGTMNFFARALSIPSAVEAAASALAAGTIAHVDIATVNGRTFVHAVGLGLHPAMVAEREKGTYRSRYGKMMMSARAFLRVMLKPRRFNALISSAEAQTQLRTAGIVVSNNLFGPGHLPYADRLDEGVLGVYVTSARSWPEIVRVLAETAVGGTDRSPLVERTRTRAVTIELARRGSAPVTVDGELIRLSGPIEVAAVPGGLKVLKPRPAEA